MAGYDVGIRDSLAKKGIANSDIGYNPQSGYVTVKGQDFMKGDRNYAGTNFTNAQNFNTAWQNYNKPSNKQPGYSGMPTASVGAYTGSKPLGVAGSTYKASGYQPPAQQVQPNQSYPLAQPSVDQRIQELYAALQNQPAFDPYSSNAYKAAEAQAEKEAQANTRQIQESFGSSGFGRSSAMGERIAGVQNDAVNYLMTQIVPQIEAQNAAAQQQKFQNLFSLLTPQQEQQRFAEDTAQSRAGLTGSFIAPEAQQIINQLMGLKSQTEQNWQTMTPEQRAAAGMEGNELRAMLQGMNVDPNLFGAGVTANQARANVGRSGIPTLEAQNQQFNQEFDINKLNEDIRRYNQDYQYTAGRDKVADAQWQAEFDYKVQQDGLDAALDWAKQTLNEQKERRVAAGKSSSSKSSGSSNYKPSTEKTIQDINMPRTAATMETYIISKLPGGKYVQGPPSPHQTELIEDMILDNPNLSEADMVKLYKKFGIPLPEGA